LFPRSRLPWKPLFPKSGTGARGLIGRHGPDWEHIIKADLFPAENYALLLNGRNVMSLKGLDTRIHEDDEIVFTVLAAGG